MFCSSPLGRPRILPSTNLKDTSRASELQISQFQHPHALLTFVSCVPKPRTISPISAVFGKPTRNLSQSGTGPWDRHKCESESAYPSPMCVKHMRNTASSRFTSADIATRNISQFTGNLICTTVDLCELWCGGDMLSASHRTVDGHLHLHLWVEAPRNSPAKSRLHTITLETRSELGS
jgi:hypothetical protein